jgi:hypothetical protein
VSAAAGVARPQQLPQLGMHCRCNVLGCCFAICSTWTCSRFAAQVAPGTAPCRWFRRFQLAACMRG